MDSLASPRCKNSGLKNIPLMWMAQGKEQVIKVDQRKILNKVFLGVGATSVPSFSEIDCGSEGVKYSVSLDLSFVEKDRVATVEGESSINKFEAEGSAVSMAFKHLYEECNIRVSDYSSRVESSLKELNNYGNVIESMDSVLKVIIALDGGLAKLKELINEVKGKVEEERKSGLISDDGLVFYSLSGVLSTFLKTATDKVSSAKIKLNHVESDRLKFYKSQSEKSIITLKKLNAKAYPLQLKHLFQFVMCYLSFGDVKYSNGPAGDDMVNAVAEFSVPRIKGLKYSGNLRIDATGWSSEEAEDNAAFKSLQFFEEEYKFKIIDLNHGDRLEAEEAETFLVCLVDRIIEVGLDMKLVLFNMVDELEEQHQDYCNEVAAILNKGADHHLLPARQFCADRLVGIEEHWKNCQKECSEHFQAVHNLGIKLRTTKKKLGIV